MVPARPPSRATPTAQFWLGSMYAIGAREFLQDDRRSGEVATARPPSRATLRLTIHPGCTCMPKA